MVRGFAFQEAQSLQAADMHALSSSGKGSFGMPSTLSAGGSAGGFYDFVSVFISTRIRPLSSRSNIASFGGSAEWPHLRCRTGRPEACLIFTPLTYACVWLVFTSHQAALHVSFE